MASLTYIGMVSAMNDTMHSHDYEIVGDMMNGDWMDMPWIYYDGPLFYLTRNIHDNSPALWCNDHDTPESICIPITEEELAAFLADNNRLREICHVGRPCYINLDDTCTLYIRTTLTDAMLQLVPYL